jgi:DNA-binding NarL/FixJ family response regulator
VIATFGTAPTPAELEALRAYLAAGSVKGAAHRLGLREQTVKNHLANARCRLGAKTTAEAVFRLYDMLVA